MSRIIASSLKDFPHQQYLKMKPKQDLSASVAYAACILVEHLGAKAVVTTTHSGFTAQQVSRFKPKTKLIALSPDRATVLRLTLYWGCIPILVEDTHDTDEMFAKTAKAALDSGFVTVGDLAVLTAGHPIWVKGTTNMLKVKEL